MSLLSVSCAYALQLGACALPNAPAAEPAGMFGTVAMAEPELSGVRGLGLSDADIDQAEAGLDQAEPAARARRVEIAFYAQRTSDQTREVVDNWNVAVATPLIAEALDAARR